MPWISLVISIVATVFSISISIYSLWVAKRKLFTDEFASYRTDWIANIRKLISEFVTLYFDENRNINAISTTGLAGGLLSAL